MMGKVEHDVFHCKAVCTHAKVLVLLYFPLRLILVVVVGRSLRGCNLFGREDSYRFRKRCRGSFLVYVPLLIILYTETRAT